MTDSGKNNAMSEIQLVVFDLASEHYGVDISDVCEIIRMQNITKVPGATCGIINLRGKVLPVLDLRKKLGLKVAEQTEESRIVVIDITDGEVGIIVDAVTEVLRVPNSSIEPPSSMITQGNSDYLRGIAKLTGRLIILLDLNKLLSSKADSEAIARVISDSVAESKSDVSEEQSLDPKNGQSRKKPEAVHKNNNNKEYAAV